MGPQGIVIADILANFLTQLFGRTELINIDQLSFQTAEPTLNHDVVGPAGLAVHALPDPQRLEEGFIAVTGKLTALVRVEDGGNAATLHRRAYSVQNGRCFQRVGQFPTHDFPAEPIDNGGQVHMAMLHFDVGNVDGPDLIGE